MKKIIYLLLFIFSPISGSIANANPMKHISVYGNGSSYYSAVENALNKCGIPFNLVDTLSNNPDSLHIVFDCHEIDASKLPKYYIVYQTLDLVNNDMPADFIKKLSNAVAVWDYSKENIKKYSKLVPAYYYLPENYEFADPVILPCLLPLYALNAYKDILKYSNSRDTDISSHLPAIFVYSFLLNPQLIIECGVGGGQSTIAFKKILSLCNAYLIGIDVDNNCHIHYKNVANSVFLRMNDLNFMQYYATSAFNNQLANIVFIDTSHAYDQTMQEIKLFEKLLQPNGIMIFHDSNVTPLNNGGSWETFNGVVGYYPGNPKGVIKAIHEYFNVDFDNARYFNGSVTTKSAQWHIVHYPYCNGLTIVRLLDRL